MIPLFYFSFLSKTNLGFVNGFITLGLGATISRIGSKYQFKVTDHLAKRQTHYELITVVSIFCGTLMKLTSSESIVFLFPLLVSLISGLEVLQNQPFFDQKIQQIFFTFHVFGIIWNSILIFGVNEKWPALSIALIVIPYPSLKLGIVIQDIRRKVMRTFFIGQSIYSFKFDEDFKASMIDIHIREISVIDKKSLGLDREFKIREQCFLEDILLQHIMNCKKRPHCFCQQAVELNGGEVYTEYFVGNDLRARFRHDYVITLYESYLEQKKRFQQIDEVNISYLFYLIEGMGNESLAFSQSVQFLKIGGENTSIEYASIISEMQSTMIKNNGQNQIMEVIDFDDQIGELHQKAYAAIQKKNSFLNEISKDFIDLLELHTIGTQFLEIRRDIEKCFYSLYQKNRENYFLQLLVQVYLVCLSFSDSKLWFESQKLGVSLKKEGFLNQMKELLYSKKSIAIFASIQKEEFGAIQKISKNIEPVFGMLKEDVIGKNCSILMTSNLGNYHNSLIWRFLKRGQLKEAYITRINPLIAKKKSGFLLPMTMKLQVGYVGIQDVGINSLVTAIKNSSEHFIMIDTRCPGFAMRIDGFTENIFNRLFEPLCNFDLNQEFLQIKASRIFPMLPFFLTKMEGKDSLAATQKTQFVEMIGFFPYNSTKLLIKQQKNEILTLQQYRAYLQNQLLREEFSTKNNILFMFALTVTYLREEKLEYCHIKINSYNEMNTKDNPIKSVRLHLQEMFREVGGINWSVDEIEQSINTSLLSDKKKISTSVLRNSQKLQNSVNSFSFIHSQSKSFMSARKLTNKTKKTASSSSFAAHMEELTFKNLSHYQTRGASDNNLTKSVYEHNNSRGIFDGTRVNDSGSKFGENSTYKLDEHPSNTQSLSLHSHHHRVNSHHQLNIIIPRDSAKPYKLSVKQRSSTIQLMSPNSNGDLIEKETKTDKVNRKNTLDEGDEAPVEFSDNEIAVSELKRDLSQVQVGSPKNTEGDNDNILDEKYLQSNLDFPSAQPNSMSQSASTNHVQIFQFESKHGSQIGHNLPSSIFPMTKSHTSIIINSPVSNEQIHRHMELHPKTSPSAYNNKSQSSNRSSQSNQTPSEKSHKSSIVHIRKRMSLRSRSKHEQDTLLSDLQPSQDQFPSNKVDPNDEDISVLSANDSSTESKDLNLSNELQSLKDLSLATSSKGSGHKSHKKVVLSSIQKKQFTFSFELVKIVAILSLIGVATVILQQYFSLDDQFHKQIKDFSYIPWGMQMRVSISSALVQHSLYTLLDSNLFSSRSDKEKRKNLFTSSFKSIVSNYIASINKVDQESRSDLVLLGYLQNYKMDVQFLNSSVIGVPISVSMLYAMMMNAQQLFEYSLFNDDSILSEAFLFRNFALFSSNLQTAQSLQEQSVSDCFSQIQQLVIQLLVIISVICGFFVVTTFFGFAYSQQKKQRILKLFSALDPHKITEMNEALLQSLSILFSDKTRMILSVGKNKAVKQKYDNNLILSKKKKLISPTSSLSQFSLALYLVSFIVFFILLVYPIVNLIITLNLINQSDSNQSLQGALQKVKAQITSNIAAYSVFLQNQILPTSQLLGQQFYKDRFYTVINGNDGVFSNFTKMINQQQQNYRFKQAIYDDFVFNSMRSDSCVAFQKYFSSYNENVLYSFDQIACKSLFQGGFQNGLLTNFGSYTQFFKDLYQIDQLGSSSAKVTEITNYLTTKDYFEIYDTYQMLILMIDTFTSFIQQTNEEFFKEMELIQTLLMIYQFIVLVLTYKYALLLFFERIQDEIYHTKRILSLFEARYLYENSYIFNFLKQ